MARLNTHRSATPIRRASTEDSLYRDPTPLTIATHNTSARQSSYSVLSPVDSVSSDKENNIPPRSRQTTPQQLQSQLPTKGKSMSTRRAQRIPTPDSGSTSTGTNNNKRRRTGNYDFAGSDAANTDIYHDEDEDDQEQYTNSIPTPDDDQGGEDEEEEELRYYNPDQNVDKRRALRISLRDNRREIEVNRDEYIKDDGSRMIAAIKKQNHFMTKVRQTADATLDSRTLVDLTDMSGKQLGNRLQANAGIGIDIDQFVSRCIYFMKEHHPPGEHEQPPIQARNRHQTQPADDDDDDESGEGLDWAFLGRNACFPSNKRPPVSSFLLGPLSLQKRARNIQARRARSQRQPLGPATRPQELRQEDIKQSENSNLTHLVKSIKGRLEEHLNNNVAKVESELSLLGPDENEQEYMDAACKRHRIYSTTEDEPAVSLFDFAVNPRSFGQTVENLFYISFLIREGNAKVMVDGDGLPLLGNRSEPNA